MLLKSLELKDFRQFKGTQEILFATDNQKNVTIILGENGSGKTSLAQAFTWCLYGKTDFDDPILLNKVLSQSMLPGQEDVVRAKIVLSHSGTDYAITSELRYRKDSSGSLRAMGDRRFSIQYKKADGSQGFVNDLQTELRMNEILPKELSKFFFFDGERIGNMSKELRKGKSKEFAEAVRSLLGLSAFISAIQHLKGHGNSHSVIRNYDDKYDSKSDSRIAEYTQKINAYNDDIVKIDERLSDIEKGIEFADEKRRTLSDKIKENENSKELAERRIKLLAQREKLVSRKQTQVAEIIKLFNKNAPSYFSKKLMRDCLDQISRADMLDRWVPNVEAATINHIIKKGRCICGADVCVGNKAYDELNALRAFIPPKSIGGYIEEFRLLCENCTKATETFFDDFERQYGDILSFEGDYADNEDEISQISKKLEGLEDVGLLQVELSKYESQLRDLQSEKSELDRKKGGVEKDRDRMETERHELTLKDKNNQRIEVYKAYAQYMHDVIQGEYKIEEGRVRTELGSAINEIFRQIYNGGLSLSLDEKYNVQVAVSDHAGFSDDIETSTAQSISIIFAFIAGVIKMARASQNLEAGSMLVSEPYPLVMDAPLSAFDKTRIKTVCTVLPEVAEQIIIFIKDTDGDIAETHLSNRIGSRASFLKKNELETYIQ